MLTSICNTLFWWIYGLILESELSIWADRNGCHSAEQTGFQEEFTTLDHILTVRARTYFCFMDFRKAFNTVLHAQLMQRLDAPGVPKVIQWRIYALYESVSGGGVVSQWVVRRCGQHDWSKTRIPTITHYIWSLFRWGITLYRKIRQFRSMPNRYSHKDITICWWYCA